MGFLDKLLGRERPGQRGGYGAPQQGDWQPPPPSRQPQASEDERAIARYQYLLRTAPPERIEEVHAEAFAALSPQQRQQVLDRLSSDLPPGEAPRTDDPQEMARAATRAEMQQPGYMQRSFGGGGMGMGGVLAGSLLGSVAGVVVGSAIAQSLFGGFDQSPEAAAVGEGSGDAGGDVGAEDASGADAGGTDGGGAEGSDGGFFGGGDGGDGGGGFFDGGDGGGGFFGGDGGGDFGGFDF